MANEQSGVKFFVILTTVVCVLGYVYCQDNDNQEVPIIETVKNLIKEKIQNSQQNFNFGNILENFGNAKLGDNANLLAGLASAWQTLRQQQDDNAQGGFDPSVLGTMMEILSNLNRDSENNNIDENNNEVVDVTGEEGQPKKKAKADGIDLGLLLNIAQKFMGSFGGGSTRDGSSGAESVFSLLSVLMSSMGQQHNTHSRGSGIPHHTHSPYLPSFLENIHEYWDHFTSTEFGKALWENSGLASLTRMFLNEEGNLDPKQFFESLEDNTFRRKWIKSISNFVAQWVTHIANPESQQRFIATVQTLANTFFQTQGYPKNTRLNFKNSESVSNLINEIFKRQMSLNINSEAYVKPAVEYIQQVLHANNQQNLSSSSEIENRLRATLDDEVVTPLLRVYRAYRFAKKNQKCTTYVLCVINAHEPKAQSGLKPAVSKAATMLAAWFLSDLAPFGFWDLYATATESSDCERFDRKCAEFHDEDERAANYHNEL